jgi:hypothetical protein
MDFMNSNIINTMLKMIHFLDESLLHEHQYYYTFTDLINNDEIEVFMFLNKKLSYFKANHKNNKINTQTFQVDDISNFLKFYNFNEGEFLNWIESLLLTQYLYIKMEQEQIEKLLSVEVCTEAVAQNEIFKVALKNTLKLVENKDKKPNLKIIK